MQLANLCLHCVDLWILIFNTKPCLIRKLILISLPINNIKEKLYSGIELIAK